MRLFRIIALCALASAPGSLFAFALPPSARIVADSNSKDAWVQNAEFDMAFAAAENLMEARLLSCGFSKKKCAEARRKKSNFYFALGVANGKSHCHALEDFRLQDRRFVGV